jgi:membrane protein
MAEADETLLQTIKRLVFDRLVSIGILLAIIFIAIVSLVLSSAVDYLFPKDSQTLTYILNESFSFFVLSLSFCVIYKWMPDLELKWKNTFIGAMITALLFVFGKFLIGLYIGQSAVGSAYGAAGSLVVLLVWVYYSSLIMFLGAEICWTSFLGDKKEEEAKA